MKRKRKDNPEDFEDGDLLPTDLEAAIRFFRNLLSCHAAQGLPLIILQTQLHSIIKDTSLLERDLDTMRREGVMRMFKMSTGQQTVAKRQSTTISNSVGSGRLEYENFYDLKFWCHLALCRIG
jgi:hypothetical protein